MKIATYLLGFPRVVQQLLQVQTVSKMTALHWAARSRSPNAADMCELLIRSGAPVDARDDEGETPLHYAAHKGASAVVTLLLQHNANPTLRNSAQIDSLTPRGVCRQSRPPNSADMEAQLEAAELRWAQEHPGGAAGFGECDSNASDGFDGSDGSDSEDSEDAANRGDRDEEEDEASS